MKPTREQVLNEPAGRQMDAWVAEYVMGWHKVCDPYIETESWAEGEGDNLFLHEPVDNWFAYTPSRDIAAAWEVVEKMRERDSIWGGWYELAHRPTGHAANFTGNKVDTVYADTAPLAICRAALLAVMEEEEL